MPVEISEFMKDAFITAAVLFGGWFLDSIRAYYAAGRKKRLLEIDTIADTNLRVFLRDAVLAIEQIAKNYLKEFGESMLSEDKLQAASDYLEKKGVKFEVEDIEAMIARLKAEGKL